ncbi:SubName: Full=Uncharacterized protein {ECO:0000313/EMBL:CCA73244.1} [Serendipita indica DSM 11827]|nr:SubName: Full=Uncharacterized protein {ECO:0000313/EMBL:CCA73244.1} [Serendipita indica DSM 11827]
MATNVTTALNSTLAEYGNTKSTTGDSTFTVGTDSPSPSALAMVALFLSTSSRTNLLGPGRLGYLRLLCVTKSFDRLKPTSVTQFLTIEDFARHYPSHMKGNDGNDFREPRRDVKPADTFPRFCPPERVIQSKPTKSAKSTMGSVFSSIGRGIFAVISAIANVFITIVNAITSVRTTKWR